MFKSLFKRKDTPLKHHVEFCISNLSFGSAAAYDELVAREDVIIEEAGCTSNCETVSYTHLTLPTMAVV